MDFSRLRTGEIVAAAGGLAMFLFLFFDWYGPEGFDEGGVSGWDALIDLPGFLIILSAVAGIALAGLVASGQRLNLPMPRGAGTAALGSLAVALILWRMVAGSPTLKIGIFLGLAAAVAIAVGALMALREDGIEPLVKVPGGRTRAASAASAPATATTASPPAPASTTSRSRSTTRKAGARAGTRKKATRSGTRKTTSRAKSSSGRSSGRRSGSSKAKSSSRSTGTRRRSSRK